MCIKSYTKLQVQIHEKEKLNYQKFYQFCIYFLLSHVLRNCQSDVLKYICHQHVASLAHYFTHSQIQHGHARITLRLNGASM